MENELSDRRKLTRKMDFTAALFYNKDRISKFLKEMDEWKVKDILKLKMLVRDFESDLTFHMTKSEEEKRLDSSSLRKINESLKKWDINAICDSSQEFIELIEKKKSILINLAGKSGLLPDYKDGMDRHFR